MFAQIRRLGTLRTIVIGVIACLIGSASVVVATGGAIGSSGSIQACYKPETGSLRLVLDTTDCRNNELGIWWDQAGPAGATGATGAAGATGRPAL